VKCCYHPPKKVNFHNESKEYTICTLFSVEQKEFGEINWSTLDAIYSIAKHKITVRLRFHANMATKEKDE